LSEFFLFVLAVWALAYAFTIENRRRREAASTRDKQAALEHEVGSLRRQLETLNGRFEAGRTEAPSAVASSETEPPRSSAAIEDFCKNCGAKLAPAAEFCTRCGAGVVVTAPPPQPEIKIPPREATSHPSFRPPASVIPIPPTPMRPPTPPPAAIPKPRDSAAATSAPATLGAASSATPPAAVVSPPAAASRAVGRTSAAIQPPKKRSRSFEEVVGIRLLPIIGIVAVVLGVGFLVGASWALFPHWLRAGILYAGGLVLLFGGIALERRSSHQILGRSLMGGGWAVVVLVTYSIANTESLQLLASKNVDLFVLLGVIAAMVWHTLKYSSQTVTGVGFLLGFLAIGINPSAPYNLIAGAMLIAGMTVIVLRYRWLELELFGMAAAYANHFWWLYRVYQQQGGRAIFPDHTASVALVIGYWVIFRVSYLVRRIGETRQESVSTAAGLLNPILFLLVMKYQGFHPEWSWKLLLALGAIEFGLGQLPVSRARRAPFQVLSSLGAVLMVASPLVRGSGNALEMIWLAGAEAFLAAGILTRERLFRSFGLIISFLTALYALSERLLPLGLQIFHGQPHHNGQTSLVFGVIAAVLYVNAHVTRSRWPALFETDVERLSLAALSWIAGAFAVGSVYAWVPDSWVAIALAILALCLSGAGRWFSISELVYASHWIAGVAFIQLIVADRNLTAPWLSVPQRVVAFSAVAALFYLSSRFVRLSGSKGKAFAFAAYAWSATSLLTLLVWYQAVEWAVAVGWIGLALALTLAGKALERNDLKWQALVLMLVSSGRALAVNSELTEAFHHLSYRFISVSLVAAATYVLARWAPLKKIRPLYTVAGTVLLAVLAFKEAPAPWTAVAWAAMALMLALAARGWKDRPLLWQAHLLAAVAAGWTLYASFQPEYRGTQVQWVTVGITALALYVLSWLTNIATVIEDERICQAYAWAASLLVSWLAWYQLDPNNVSLAWGIFALLLFEFQDLAKRWKSVVGPSAESSWRGQAYVALAGSFAHIFYANFNLPRWGPAAYLVLPLVLIYFYVYWQLQRRELTGFEKRLRIDAALACLGTATLGALARFDLPADAVVIGYAGLVVATLMIAWLARRRLFLLQALAMLIMAAFRISMYNFYHLNDAVGPSLISSVWAIALVACAVPIAFQVRKWPLPANARQGVAAILGHPEQPMFFVPAALVAVLLYLKLSGGKLTGAWCAEGFVVFVSALFARERSFRLTGLSLILLSIAKLVYDTFFFNNPQIRYLTWIGVGILVLVVAFLYGKNREALRDYL
jgi:hypothetical protein